MQSTFTAKATAAVGHVTLVRVVITGFDDGVRWKRYLGLATSRRKRPLRVLKSLLEK